MMQGVVNQNCEATISLVLVNESGQRQLITSVIDTGFNGFFTLPSTIIKTLNLP